MLTEDPGQASETLSDGSCDVKATIGENGDDPNDKSKGFYECWLYAKANPGYEFKGFVTKLKENYDESDFLVRLDANNFDRHGDGFLVNVNIDRTEDAKSEGTDQSQVDEARSKARSLNNWNEAPDHQFYAIFKETLFNVKVEYFQPVYSAEQSSTCGTWTRELTTDGKVLLTAIPKPDFIIKEWLDANGTVIKENPITVENEDVTYYPNFDLAPFEMPNSTLATFSHVYFVNYEAAKPDGLKAYKVTAIGANGLTLEQVKQVNANTGVIIEAEPNETYTMTYNGVIFPKDQEGNLLKSSASGPVPANGKIYVLANKDSKGLGFYKLADNEVVPKGKAYLELDDANSARDFFGFDDGTTTSISSVTEVEQPTPIYNMAGQRVSGSFSGLVIQNGRKYIRK